MKKHEMASVYTNVCTVVLLVIISSCTEFYIHCSAY